MTTKQLFVYIVTFLTVVAVLFGFVPPLLNAKSSLQNAIGVGLALIILVAAALTAHATYTSNPAVKPDNKEQ